VGQVSRPLANCSRDWGRPVASRRQFDVAVVHRRSQTQIFVDHRRYRIDNGSAAGAALIAEPESRRRGRVGRSRLRREGKGLEFAGDRRRGSRQRIDTPNAGAQARSA
jgi:hypothetical protein